MGACKLSHNEYELNSLNTYVCMYVPFPQKPDTGDMNMTVSSSVSESEVSIPNSACLCKAVEIRLAYKQNCILSE